MAPLALDHIAIAAGDLHEGVAWAEARLGLPFGPGGRHPQMGTWNRLLSLGPDIYLEVIAVDPTAPAPPHPRWFGLDMPTPGPRLHLVLRDPGLTQARDHRIHALSRDELTWDFAVPNRGGLAPGLIDWGATTPPAGRLPDGGLRLVHLTLPPIHGLPPIGDPRVRVDADGSVIEALIQTPNGFRRL